MLAEARRHLPDSAIEWMVGDGNMPCRPWLSTASLAALSLHWLQPIIKGLRLCAGR